jgi:hypothetical protein
MLGEECDHIGADVENRRWMGRNRAVRHIFGTMLFVGLPLSLLLTVCKSTQAGAAEKPSILFILSDDHAWQAVSAYSDSLIYGQNMTIWGAENT